MSKKRKLKLIIGGFLFLIAIILFFIFFYIIDNNVYESIYSINLTEKEKIEDFEYIYNTITGEYSNLNEYSKLYSIDVEARKNLYIEKIKNTKSDYEFYCTLYALMNDISSFHTKITFPSTNEYINGGFYNSENIIKIKNIDGYTDYWHNLMRNECMNLPVSNTIWFEYKDGKYILGYSGKSALNGKCYIETINGMPPDEYLLNNLSGWKISYDFVNKKSYRPYCVFTDLNIGVPIKVEVSDFEGKTETCHLYSSPALEITAWYSNYFNNMNITDKTDYTYYSEKIGYVEINNFYSDSVYTAKACQKISNCENIIVDIRNNPGGTTEFINEYVYKYMFSRDIKENTTRTMLNTGFNRKLFDIFHKDKYGNKYTLSDDGKNLIINDIENFDGNPINKKSNFYLLISENSGSAADSLASIVKKNNLGTVVGSNTGGEGLTGTYVMDCLPNSKILFTYNPCQAINMDGTDNSVYGTAPDIYVNQTIDGFYLKQRLTAEGEDPYTYENRLKWDNVLTETIEMIKENENDKGNNPPNE